MLGSQVIFLLVLIITLGFFGFTMSRILGLFKFVRPAGSFDKIGSRISLTLLVAFGQSKILRKPVAGLFHAMVWWGFLVILLGTIEMIIDGLSGLERSLSFLGGIYDLITASGEIFGALIIIACLGFLARRYLGNVKRFTAPEMKPSSRMDATFVLCLILALMLSLIGMNMGYVAENPDGYHGAFPVSMLLIENFSSLSLADMAMFEHVNWWLHICLVLIFLNILPYSKHFHVIMAVPNVFMSRLEPKAQLNVMESVTKEVKLMMNPDTAFSAPEGEVQQERFGVKDVEDVTWKNLIDSFTCTECGRCSDVCPANITGKKLSPRKLMKDMRARMKVKGQGFRKNGKGYSDDKSLVGSVISEEEIWACTSCMACMEECPVMIDHVPFIIDMRRYLVMEESKANPELNMMFNNIENNGAPWQFSPEDRMRWAENLNSKYE